MTALYLLDELKVDNKHSRGLRVFCFNEDEYETNRQEVLADSFKELKVKKHL